MQDRPVEVCRITHLRAYLLPAMPRISLVVRAARRAAIAFSIFPATRKSPGGHFPSRSHTCPYCSKTLQSRTSRDRHIITKSYCHERHLYALSHPVAKRRKRKRKRDTHLPSTDEPLRKNPRIDDSPSRSSVADPAPTPAGGDARGSACGTQDTGDEQTCEQPFVEKFPIPTTGAPISDAEKPKPDLRVYLESCGALGNPELFSTAELLMMTVPKSKDRTLHLKSPAVSSMFHYTMIKLTV